MMVSEIKRTCGACPSQWEGRLDDGRFLYVRFRWGSFGFGIGASESAAVENCKDPVLLDRGRDGYMSDKDMVLQLAQHEIVVPETAWPRLQP